MRHRFFLPDPLATGAEVRLTGDEFHHAARVLRVREGEEVELFDGRGAVVTARVGKLATDHVVLTVVDTVAERRESPLAIDLAMSIIQLEKFEIVLQKATELGVRRIIPLETDRIEVRAERYRGKPERWNKIIYEAVKQSGRAQIPQLDTPVGLETLLARDGLKIIFDADVEPSQLPDVLTEATLLVGPEGGWSEAELEAARTAGCFVQRLGPRRLRAETAAIVGVALLAARYGDLG